MIYVRVDDVRETVERLRADGVAIANEPHVIFSDADGTFGPAGSDEWMAFITDSEGNLVGLASQHAPEPAEYRFAIRPARPSCAGALRRLRRRWSGSW